ncbi:MAG: heavy-metal-associated domain-containing protein [Gordonia sp. (in: high G+C Gram-positive bacteria)]
MTTTTFTVSGMTCAHCAASVREEIGEIPGVRNVDIKVESGLVEVTSDAELDRNDVAAAVVEAGYELV